MTQDTTTTTIGQPFEELDVYTFHVDGVEYHVEIDQEIDHALRTYITTRYPATIRRIYLDPLGVPGGEYARGDDHLCVPTIEIIYHIPEDAEHAHLDGKRQRVECYNAPYVLALRDDLPAEDYEMNDCYEPPTAADGR